MQEQKNFNKNVLIYNPPSPEGKHIMRSYSGGFGNMDDLEGAKDRIIFPPAELLMIAENLRKENCNITFIDYQVQQYNEKDFISFLKERNFDIVISSVSLPTYQNDCYIAELCKKNASSKVYIRSSIVFEQFVQEVLLLSKCDAVIFPNSLMDICDIIQDFKDMPNVAYMDSQLTIRIQEYEGNIDTYPMIALDLIENKKYMFPFMYEKSIPNITTLHTSYGCPYPCYYYCPYPLTEGRRYKAMSCERVVEELLYINNKGVGAVIIRDPLFTFDKERVFNICQQIINLKLELKWWCETRIDCLDVRLLSIMKKANCIGVEVGVETGDEIVMMKQAKKGLTLDKLYEFKQLANKIGLHIQYLFIVGLPEENSQSIIKTLKLILDLGLNKSEYNISIITPYLGTPLYYDALEKKWITNDWKCFTGYSVVMRTDKLTLEQMKELHTIISEMETLIMMKNQVSEVVWQDRKSSFINRIEEWGN